MCGISGFNYCNPQLIKRMNSIIRYRGPDDEGVFSDKKVTLGQRRLSIIDLSSGGYQPMFYSKKLGACSEKHNRQNIPKSSICMVFNGEIYNYKELREELRKKGYAFATQSDTEVILASYTEWEFDCIKKLNGMWAFCLYDFSKQILFLGRDRMGIKPLYYYLKAGKLAFASEIKAILADKSIRRVPCKEAIADYISFQNIMDDKTFFQDIKLLLPAHYLVFDLMSRKLIKKRYWSPDFTKKQYSGIDECLAEFKSIFHDSVKRHLISDVPVGSYLSGGFDSSAVSEQASEMLSTKKSRINTFTGRFDNGKKYDETACSREVARKINANLFEVTVTPKMFLSGIYKMAYHIDEPKSSLSAIAQYYVSRLASKHVRVVLTGHAGDELFAGYPVYKATYFKHLAKKNPLNIFRLNFFKPSELPRAMYFILFPLIDSETRHGHFLLFSKRQRKKLFTREFASALEGYNPIQNIKKMYDPKLDMVDNVQKIYMQFFLPSMLIIEDKLGMASSIEARTPFCDNELVEFSLRVPMKYKLYHNTMKYLVKEGMRDKLPKVLYKQPKRGFPTPLSLWARKELKKFLYELLLSEKSINRGIFNQDAVRDLLDKHCKRKTDTLLDLVNANRIWALMNVELWFRLFIDQDKEALRLAGLFDNR